MSARALTFLHTSRDMANTFLHSVKVFAPRIVLRTSASARYRSSFMVHAQPVRNTFRGISDHRSKKPNDIARGMFGMSVAMSIVATSH